MAPARSVGLSAKRLCRWVARALGAATAVVFAHGAMADPAVEVALERISRNTREALSDTRQSFVKGWASADVSARLEAAKTVAVFALFEPEPLEVIGPHFDEAIELGRRTKDYTAMGLLQMVQGIVVDRELSGKDALVRQLSRLETAADTMALSGSPTAKCLGLLLRGKVARNGLAETEWVPFLLEARQMPGASAACRSWATAEIHGRNGYRITAQSQSQADSALAELAAALRETPPAKYPSLGGQLQLAVGVVNERSDRLGEVEPNLRRALALARGVGDTSLEVASLDMLEYLFVKLNRPRDVLDVLKESAPLMAGMSPVDRALWHLRNAEMSAKLTPPDAPVALASLKEAQLLLAGESENRLTRRLFEVSAEVHERLGNAEAALAQTRQLLAITQRQISEEHAQQLASLQVQFDVKAKALENETLRVSVGALTERRNLLISGLVLAALASTALGLLLRRQWLQKRHVVHLYSQLEKLNASRSDFLAAACHDLRQPAQSLSLLAELAHGKGGANAQETEVIRRNTDTLDDMLSQLLDMAQLERGDLVVHIGPVSVDALFDEAVRQFQPLATRRGLELQAVKCGLWVRSDAQLLRRVLFNLVSNACKYSDRGRVDLKAGLGHAQADVVVTVSDTGRGIPKERIADMLRPYSRLDHGAQEQGLGIGLSVVQRATQKLGHELTIDSMVGQGTMVRLSLPRSAPESVVGEASLEPAEPSQTPSLVAVVDDNPEILESMGDLLTQWGYAVALSPNGPGLDVVLAGRRPDLVLLDNDINGESGLALAATLAARPDWVDVVLILFTGTVSQDVERRAQDLKMQLVVKPVRPSQLRRSIDRALSGRRLRAAA